MNQTDDQMQTPLPTGVGERLRTAREAQSRELEEIAAITRVPLRHLRAIETGDHAELPATPYSVGFVRTYAQALGLDAVSLAQDFRAELGQAPPPRKAPEPFEPADPKRVPSRLLAIIALLIAVALAGGYAVLRSGALTGEGADARARLAAAADAPAPAASIAQAPPAPAAAAPAGGPVVVTATEPVWLRIYEGNGGKRYVEKVMQPGEAFQVPADAKDPQILTGRPQSIRVTVGQTVIPPLGTPERTIADVSLLAPALLARAASAPAAAGPAGAVTGDAQAPAPAPAP
jgi:cytoskeleton protein RodZ